MIKAIIFDCFGVLTGDLWKEFVGSLPEEQKQQARSLNRALDSGILSHEDFYIQINELTGRKPKEVENIINADMQKNEALFSYIGELSKTHKIGLLSNISSQWITEHFLSSDEQGMFDAIVTSVEIGVVKPDGRAFTTTAERLGVESNECIMVDDSEPNCEGARAAGMQAVVYYDFPQFKHDIETLLSA